MINQPFYKYSLELTMVYNSHLAGFCLQSTVCIMQCAVCNVQYETCFMNCRVCSVQWDSYNVQCAVCVVQWDKFHDKCFLAVIRSICLLSMHTAMTVIWQSWQSNSDYKWLSLQVSMQIHVKGMCMITGWLPIKTVGHCLMLSDPQSLFYLTVTTANCNSGNKIAGRPNNYSLLVGFSRHAKCHNLRNQGMCKTFRDRVNFSTAHTEFCCKFNLWSIFFSLCYNRFCPAACAAGLFKVTSIFFLLYFT